MINRAANFILLQYKVLFSTKDSELVSRNYLHRHRRHGIRKSEIQDSQPAPETQRWNLETGTPKVGPGTQDPS